MTKLTPWTDGWVALCEEHFKRDYRPNVDAYSEADYQELMCQVDGCNDWATKELDVGIVPVVEDAVKDMENGNGIPFEDYVKKRFQEGL